MIRAEGGLRLRDGDDAGHAIILLCDVPPATKSVWFALRTCGAKDLRYYCYAYERIAIRAPQRLANFRTHSYCSSGSIDGWLRLRLPVNLLNECPAFAVHPDHRSMPCVRRESLIAWIYVRYSSTCNNFSFSTHRPQHIPFIRSTHCPQHIAQSARLRGFVLLTYYCTVAVVLCSTLCG